MYELISNEMKPRQKILFVVTKPVWGGAQKYVYDLAANLPQGEFDCAIAAGGEGILTDKLREIGIRILSVPGLQRDVYLFKEIFSFWQLRKLFSAERPDIIHLNSSKAGVLGSIAARASFLGPRRPKMVFTVHGWGFNEDRPFWQKTIIFLASWFASFFQDAVILINSKDLDSAKKFIPRKKLHLIFNGIANPEFLPRAHARQLFSEKMNHALEPQTPLIGTIAELTKNKGLQYFIDALGNLADKDFRAVIIGDGEEKDKLNMQIQKRGLSNKVHLAGFMPDAKKYLSGFDIFALSSVKEGLPYVLMEAMHAGLPIVATRVGGVPDMIEHGRSGLMVSPRNTSHLAEALGYLLRESKKRQTFGVRAQEKAATQFKRDPMLQKTISLYRKLAHT